MPSPKRKKLEPQVVAAIIAGVFACIVAFIGLGQPVISRVVEIYWPVPSPTPPLDSTAPQTQPTGDSLLTPRISISLTVEANREWQNTRIVVEEGELVQITNDLSGKWRGDEGALWLDGTGCTGSAYGKPHLLPTAPGGSLIAKVDDSDPLCVGNNLLFHRTLISRQVIERK